MCHVDTDATVRVLTRLDDPRVTRYGVTPADLPYLLVFVIVAEEFVFNFTAGILERIVAPFVRIGPPMTLEGRLLPLRLHHRLLLLQVLLDLCLPLIACLLNQ